MSGARILCLAMAALAADASPCIAAPPPQGAPTRAEVRTCIQDVDPAGRGKFDWKSIEIGAPRGPLNNYEAAGHPDRNFTGYPVHAVYSFGGFETIDATYWMNRDANGHWQIPYICVLN
jgi:hypothetical protein